MSGTDGYSKTNDYGKGFHVKLSKLEVGLICSAIALVLLCVGFIAGWFGHIRHIAVGNIGRTQAYY